MSGQKWKGNINRAILDAAAPFNNLGKVAEEYLTNSLDAFEAVIHDRPKENLNRANCKIQLIIDHSKSQLIFKDEHPYLGMSSNKIFKKYFNIHGTNEERKRYVNVRGKHGTGKSAAFGINAEYLLIDSVYDGKRTTIKSTYDSLNKESEEPADLDDINVDKPTDLPCGTNVIIQLIASDAKKIMDLRSITKCVLHIKKVFGRHLNNYNLEIIEISRKGKTSSERITYQPREAVYEKKYPVPFEVAQVIGQTELIIKRAAEPLEDTEEKGISITSGGYTKEQTMFGLDNEPYANHFFGEWEIPSLDKYKGPNPPSLSTRKLELNQDNELVKSIYMFGKQILKEEIQLFAKDENLRKQDERLKKLSHMANELATVLNEDFAEFEETNELDKGSRGKTDLKGNDAKSFPSTESQNDSDVISHLGNEIKVEPVGNGHLKGSVTSGDFPSGAKGKSDEPSEIHSGPLEPSFEESKNQELKENAARRAKRRIRSGGGFRIDFIHPGHNSFITRFDDASKIIFINMDSDIVETQLENCEHEEESPAFKTYAYTLAVDEYARAVVNIMSANHEFSGMSSEEYLQEGVTELGIIKRRVLSRLSLVIAHENA